MRSCLPSDRRTHPIGARNGPFFCFLHSEKNSCLPFIMMIQCLIMDKQIVHEKNRFESYLENEGLKLTAGRALVFEQVMRTHGHFAPEGLVKDCKQQKRDVSRATIYRSLKELLVAGIIRETAFGEKHKLYEHIYDEKPHHHARCVRCHHILEFPDSDAEQVYKPILEKHGFQILGHEVHFYGLCKHCQNIKN